MDDAIIQQSIRIKYPAILKCHLHFWQVPDFVLPNYYSLPAQIGKLEISKGFWCKTDGGICFVFQVVIRVEEN